MRLASAASAAAAATAPAGGSRLRMLSAGLSPLRGVTGRSVAALSPIGGSAPGPFRRRDSAATAAAATSPSSSSPASAAAAAAAAAACVALRAGPGGEAAVTGVRGMAGHSKWANIRHKKGLTDLKRAKMFMKLSREITSAVRVGGPDRVSNAALVGALSRARAANMPKSNIEAAIASGSGAGKDGAAPPEAVSYEIVAPGGVCVLVHASTDNRNRTSAAVKHAATSNGATLAPAAFAFRQAGVLSFDLGHRDEENVMELALSAAAEDYVIVGGADSSADGEKEDDSGDTNDAAAVVYMHCDRKEFLSARQALGNEGVELRDAELSHLATREVEGDALSEEQAAQLRAMVDMLDDHDDVTQVFSNYAPLMRWPFVLPEH